MSESEKWWEACEQSPNAGLLRITLMAAVPLWIERLAHKNYDEILARARECGQIVAEKGDIIQFKSKKRGETAAAFNALAEGLACLAFTVGGVRFMDLHFEYKKPVRGRAKRPVKTS